MNEIAELSRLNQTNRLIGRIRCNAQRRLLISQDLTPLFPHGPPWKCALSASDSDKRPEGPKRFACRIEKVSLGQRDESLHDEEQLILSASDRRLRFRRQAPRARIALLDGSNYLMGSGSRPIVDYLDSMRSHHVTSGELTQLTREACSPVHRTFDWSKLASIAPFLNPQRSG